MLRGEPVTVLAPTVTYDEGKNENIVYGIPVEGGEPEGVRVENVLWGRPETDRIAEIARYHGATVRYTLGFPKGFTGELRGCKIRRERDGAVYDVIGDPAPLPPEICPTPWNMEVDVGDSDG